jgi:hypothetical protein
MIVLPVDIGRPIEGYSSAEAAIAAAKGHPRHGKARADGELLAGQSFVGGSSTKRDAIDYCWRDANRADATVRRLGLESRIVNGDGVTESDRVRLIRTPSPLIRPRPR